MIRTSYVLLISCLLGFTACQNDFIYDQTVAPEAATWTYDAPIEFDFNIQDTSSRYTFLLDVEHSIDYSYQNLYTQIHTIFPGDTAQVDIVSLELADQLGLWEGSCRSGKCQLTIQLQENARFVTPGDYTLRFDQHTRQDSLPGIKALRLRIAQQP